MGIEVSNCPPAQMDCKGLTGKHGHGRGKMRREFTPGTGVNAKSFSSKYYALTQCVQVDRVSLLLCLTAS